MAPRTHLIDEEAAVRLLAAVVERARHDIIRPSAKPEDRVSGYQVFQTFGMALGDVDGNQDKPLGARGGKAIGKAI